MKIGGGEAVKGAYKVAHPRADPLTAYNTGLCTFRLYVKGEFSEGNTSAVIVAAKNREQFIKCDVRLGVTKEI